jgi:galactonate dehydratase
VVDSPIERIDGAWQIPTRPGLGVEVNEVEAARHPFQQEIFHTLNAVMPDGTVVDW